MKNTRNKNKIYLGLLAGTVVLLLMFTYISTQVYRHSIPTVETAEIFSGTVKRTYTMEGVFNYGSSQDISFPVPVIVEEVYVRAGEAVGEGMKLMKLDTAYLEIERLKLELEIEELLEMEANVGDEREKQIAVYERLKKEDKLAAVQEIIDAEGVLCADYKGEIRSICSETGVVQSADKLLVSVCDKTADAEISWVMKEESIIFERFFADVRVSDGHDIKTTTIVIEDVQKSYDVKTDMVYYTAVVEKTDKLWAMHDAEAVQVTSHYVSEVYPTLVPASAVSYETDGSACVYELKSRAKSFGTEYYVKKQSITVLDKDDNYVATNANLKGADIVVNSSKKLADRAAVWVEE